MVVWRKTVKTHKGSVVSSVEKPCIRKCCLDENDVCLGCFRTYDDMLVWSSLTYDEKVHLLEKAKERKKAHQQL